MMKSFKSITALSLLFLSFTASSQIRKGTWQLGLSGTQAFGFIGKSGFQQFGTSALINYSPSNRFSIGLMPYFGVYRHTNPSDFKKSFETTTQTYTSAGLNLNARLYFKDEEKKFRPYFSAQVGGGYTDHVSTWIGWNGTGKGEGDFNVFNLGVGIGGSYRISKSLYADANLMISSFDNLDTSTYSIFAMPSIGIIKTLK